MNEALDLNDFTVKAQRRSLPEYMWRVRHPLTQSTIDRETKDHYAADHCSNSDPPRNHQELYDLVHAHITWRPYLVSPFLSLFANEQDAYDWARTWERIGMDRSDIVIHKINTSKLDEDAVVFSMKYLEGRLGIKRYVPWDGEYLILNRIPHEAIFSVRSLQSVDESKE
jgi:hypothetical protein